MINIATITTAIATRLADHPSLKELGVRCVARGEYINRDPVLTPWIGIYRTGVTYDPVSLGNHTNSWKAKIKVDIAAQANNAQGGDATEDELEELVQTIMSVIMEDKTFGNVVAMTAQITVSYDYQQNDSSTLDFQMATISLTMEVRTN